MRYALAFLLALSMVGCGATAPTRSSATPVTLSSTASMADEMSTACDSWQARRVRSPVILSDGTPVWCF